MRYPPHVQQWVVAMAGIAYYDTRRDSESFNVALQNILHNCGQVSLPKILTCIQFAINFKG